MHSYYPFYNNFFDESNMPIIRNKSVHVIYLGIKFYNCMGSIEGTNVKDILIKFHAPYDIVGDKHYAMQFSFKEIKDLYKLFVKETLIKLC